MRKTNPAITDEEVAKIISEVDLDGDGTINFDGKRRTTRSSCDACLPTAFAERER